MRGGLLLWGPPGCGKTFLARAVAGELGARFATVGLHQVLDMWLGNSEKQLHELFEMARRSSPCVLFFDELDAIGHSRMDLGRSAARNVVAQLLVELDGVERSNEGIFVIGATNQPWDVDPALRRPGRFDRTMLVLPPDAPAREAILRSNLRDRPIGRHRLPRRWPGPRRGCPAPICASSARRRRRWAWRRPSPARSSSRSRPSQVLDAMQSIRPSTGTLVRVGPEPRPLCEHLRRVRRAGDLPAPASQPVAVAVSGVDGDVESLLAQSDALFAVKRFGTAAERAADAARKEPDDPRAYRAWSRALRGDGQFAEAARKADEAIRLAPESAQGFCLRSIALSSLARSLPKGERGRARRGGGGECPPGGSPGAPRSQQPSRPGLGARPHRRHRRGRPGGAGRGPAGAEQRRHVGDRQRGGHIRQELGGGDLGQPAGAGDRSGELRRPQQSRRLPPCQRSGREGTRVLAEAARTNPDAILPRQNLSRAGLGIVGSPS